MCEAYPSTKTFNSISEDLKILTAMSLSSSCFNFLSLSDGSLRSWSGFSMLCAFFIDRLVLSIDFFHEHLL